MDDWDLLRAYGNEGSEEAFATLTSRYVDLVYSAALRQCGDAEQARDVTQAVFLILARKGGKLRQGTILSGWLYRTARYVALEAVRAESRRKQREKAMAQMNTEAEPTPEELWKEVSPRIDAAMERLNESDREAVLLRFFHGRSLRELARILGVTEEAAKKRVSRALERLRHQLRREGLTSSGSLLGAALTAYAVQSAPSAMGSVISTAVCGGSIASVEILSNGALHMIAVTKFKTAAACVAAVALMTGTVTVSVHHARVSQTNLRLQGQINHARLETRAGEEQSRSKIAAVEKENRELQRQAQQLHQLRNTVAQLQAAKQPQFGTDSGAAMRLQSAPPQFRATAETLRELQFEQFVAAGRKALTLQPLTEEERVDYIGEIDFFKQVGLALRIYASKHGDLFPTALDQLFETDLLTEPMKKQLQDGRYEYHVFQDAETKPGLPAVWWRAADARGIRMMVMNDGSSHMIREPVGVESPGDLAMGGAK